MSTFGVSRCHCGCQVEEKLLLGVIHAGHCFCKAPQFTGSLATYSPHRFCLRLRPAQLYWRCAIIEKHVKGNPKGLGVLFQGLNAGDGVAVLDAGCIAAQQSRALFNVTLAEVPCLAQLSQSFADYHNRESTVSGSNISTSSRGASRCRFGVESCLGGWPQQATELQPTLVPRRSSSRPHLTLPLSSTRCLRGGNATRKYAAPSVLWLPLLKSEMRGLPRGIACLPEITGASQVEPSSRPSG
jgi:hypothetical protein